jgi:hypothetical protein
MESKMTNAQHTPGPWELVSTVSPQTLNLFGAAANHEYHIGTFLSGSRKDLETFKANARLIAAAPDLLTACEVLINTLMHKAAPKEIDLARAAIAKARGGAA